MSRAEQRAVGRPAPGANLRQRNKEDKLRRIQAAARTLFVGKGYDEATMREIARLADVGLGTLFLYAADKRDLLFLAYNKEHDQIVAAASGFQPSERPLVDNLRTYFRAFYEIFAAEPDFTRYILREVTFYNVGLQAARATAARNQIIKGIERLVTHARQQGEFATPESDKTIAHLLFGVFQAEVRFWLAEPKPATTPGLRQLTRMFAMVIRGLRGPGR